jgi:hypothetical protein
MARNSAVPWINGGADSRTGAAPSARSRAATAATSSGVSGTARPTAA